MTFPIGISHADAVAIVQRVGAEHRCEVERVALREARGRVVASDVVAPMDLPCFDNSAMDGYAMRSADLARASDAGLRLGGEQFAGAALPLQLAPGECVRITTGAPLPNGADTVVIRENTRLERDRLWIEPGSTQAGANLRRAGGDVRAGQCVRRSGDTLTSAALGLLASLGLVDIHVARRPSVAGDRHTGGPGYSGRGNASELAERAAPGRPSDLGRRASSRNARRLGRRIGCSARSGAVCLAAGPRGVAGTGRSAGHRRGGRWRGPGRSPSMPLRRPPRSRALRGSGRSRCAPSPAPRASL